MTWWVEETCSAARAPKKELRLSQTLSRPCGPRNPDWEAKWITHAFRTLPDSLKIALSVPQLANQVTERAHIVCESSCITLWPKGVTGGVPGGWPAGPWALTRPWGPSRVKNASKIDPNILSFFSRFFGPFWDPFSAQLSLKFEKMVSWKQRYRMRHSSKSRPWPLNEAQK